MSDWQAPEKLLEIALDALRREVLPALEGDTRYTGLMIANAVAIARRQCLSRATAADADALASGGELERRLSLERDAAATSPPAELGARLVAAIRSGAADPGTSLHDPLLAHLVDQACRELEISNPRYRRRDR